MEYNYRHLHFFYVFSPTLLIPQPTWYGQPLLVC